MSEKSSESLEVNKIQTVKYYCGDGYEIERIINYNLKTFNVKISNLSIAKGESVTNVMVVYEANCTLEHSLR